MTTVQVRGWGSAARAFRSLEGYSSGSITITTVTSPITSANQSAVGASGTVTAGMTVTVTLTDRQGGTASATATVSGTSWTLTGLNAAGLVDGSITWTVRAKLAGIVKATATTSGTKSAGVVGLSTTASGVWGAGFQNAGDIGRASIHGGVPLVLTGADVAGIHLSDTGGDFWQPNNTGFSNTNDFRVAALRLSETTANRCYAYTSSNDGSSGGKIWYGDYDPGLGVIVRWTPLCSLSSGASAGNAGDNHPRQTGRKLMALDEAHNVLYVGTVDGVWRVPTTPGSPVRVALAGVWVTSVSLDPQDTTILYATADGPTGNANRGVLRITSARSGSAVVTVNGTWPYAQACVTAVEGGTTKLYVATGRELIQRWAGGTVITSGWTDITSNANSDEPSAATKTKWSGIDAVRVGSATVVLVTDSYQTTGHSGTAVRWAANASGSVTWTLLNSQASYKVNDSSGATWWLDTQNRSLMLDGGGFDSVSPVIDRDNPTTTWIIFGRSGIWRTVNGGTAWYPVVKGLAVTTSWGVRTQPGSPLKVLLADVDWTSFRSTDGLVTQPTMPPSLPPGGGTAWNLAVGQAGSTRSALATSDPDTNSGGAASTHPNVWAASPGAWTNEVLAGGNQPYSGQAATPACIGVALGTDGSGTDVLLAAFRGDSSHTGGIRRKVGLGAGGAWSTPTTGGVAIGTVGKTIRVTFAWPNDGAAVWMLDPNTGIWQSLDRGATWTRRQTFSHGNLYNVHVRADPSRVGVFWFVKPSELWRVTGGHTSSPTLTQMAASTISSPSSVAAHPSDGRVAVGENGSGRLWVTADNGATWSEKTHPDWSAAAVLVKDLWWAEDGTLWTALFSGYTKTLGL